MTIKQRIAGIAAGIALCLTAAAPAALADGSVMSTTTTGGMTTTAVLTPAQVAAINSISVILGQISGQLQVVASSRTADNVALAQMQVQLSGMLNQLSAGPVTQFELANMSATLSNMTAQVQVIANRRTQENTVIVALQNFLANFNVWLMTLV